MRLSAVVALAGVALFAIAPEARADGLVVAADRKWPAPPAPAPAPPPAPTGYVPVSPFQDDLSCAVIPYPRCGPYPFIAFGLTRTAMRGKREVQALALLPIVTPPFVLAIVVILLFGRSGAISAGIFFIRANVYGFQILILS